MKRYFIELSYLGAGYAGFQVQENAATIQGEVEKALAVFLRRKVLLTGSSRTDTGVHALQNYFHTDTDMEMDGKLLYGLNSLLPAGIAVRSITQVEEGSHCRFDAIWRQYAYIIYAEKDPFREGRGYYYPFELDMEEMNIAARVVMKYHDFSAFAKRNSQVSTYRCTIFDSVWEEREGCKVYRVRANRFLRGMVRGLVGTMLKVGRKKITVDQFRMIIENRNSGEVDFAVPGKGLYLEKVQFRDGYFS